MKKEMKWGGWSIDKNLFEKITKLLPYNSIILEFGSGFGSGELSKYYTVYSIEHDEKWLNKYPVNYIYAPLKPLEINNNINWYNVDILKKEIPDNYNLILVDGPPKSSSKYEDGRMGFYYNLGLFNLDNVILIFDDVERNKEFENMKLIAKVLNRKYEIFNGDGKKNKKFAIIYLE